jgi:hypothetical protein
MGAQGASLDAGQRGPVLRPGGVDKPRGGRDIGAHGVVGAAAVLGQMRAPYGQKIGP